MITLYNIAMFFLGIAVGGLVLAGTVMFWMWRAKSRRISRIAKDWNRDIFTDIADYPQEETLAEKRP